MLQFMLVKLVLIQRFTRTSTFICLGQKLKEALDMQLFQRAADDQFSWIRESEKHLDSEDIGKDLLSVRFLLKKHEV